MESTKKKQEKTGKILIEIVVRHDGILDDAEAKRLADKAIKKMLSNNNVFLSLILKTFVVGAGICLAIYVLLRLIKWS